MDMDANGISKAVVQQINPPNKSCAGEMDEIVKASKHAASMGGSQIYLEENEEMKVEDMLKGITIGSANDVVVIKKQSQVIGKEIII